MEPYIYMHWVCSQSLLESTFVLRVCSSYISFNICYLLYTSLFNSANPTLLSQMGSTNLVEQSPSNVCRVCLEGNSNAVWLLWLKCTSPEEHKDGPQTTVTINRSSLTQLVRVRDLPRCYSNTDPSQLALCGNPTQCHVGESCRLAHSDEELNYWKWQIVKKIYTGQVSSDCMV